jgi:hypothetical protein
MPGLFLSIPRGQSPPIDHEYRLQTTKSFCPDDLQSAEEKRLEKAFLAFMLLKKRPGASDLFKHDSSLHSSWLKSLFSMSSLQVRLTQHSSGADLHNY